MPRPQSKTEAILREYEIADVVRAEINRLVAGYRRRLLEVVPVLIDEFRLSVQQGTLPAVDPDAIRNRLYEFESVLEMEAGDD